MPELDIGAVIRPIVVPCVCVCVGGGGEVEPLYQEKYRPNRNGANESSTVCYK